MFFTRSKLLVGSVKKEKPTLLDQLHSVWAKPDVDDVTNHDRPNNSKRCNCLLPLLPSIAALELPHSICCSSYVPSMQQKSIQQQQSPPASICDGLYYSWPYNLNGIILHTPTTHNNNNSSKASEIKVKFASASVVVIIKLRGIPKVSQRENRHTFECVFSFLDLFKVSFWYCSN